MKTSKAETRLIDTPAGAFAALISARRSGDRMLERDMILTLRQRFGVEVTFGTTDQPEVPANG
ncbi:hypothetical protein [Rosistilla oblonga]|uniref:Uncharacterized protein n=1 Tax=Rosistilla oblonga TaxID=2527990 RepID=A0A518ITH9_9BACT|nr:hypothetical protein [Rosistilla oblonga]QDV56394.1 hypothetical protein Mal33_23840 [Rosistilla oblonga]